MESEGWTVAVVELSQGLVAKIDADMLPLIAGAKWVATRQSSTWYAVRGKGRGREYMHRVLMGAKPGQVVDHINLDGLDNRRSNLRICTHQQNIWNGRPRGGACGYKGVAKHKGKFAARITVNGKNLYLGLHDYPELAALAYNQAALDHFGEFARLNDIPNTVNP